MTDLRLDVYYNRLRPMFEDRPELGTYMHARKAMKHLGIDYDRDVPQMLGDQWWFFDCRNIPENLPKWLRELNLSPDERKRWVA
jgi:hypothetical protein